MKTTLFLIASLLASPALAHKMPYTGADLDIKKPVMFGTNNPSDVVKPLPPVMTPFLPNTTHVLPGKPVKPMPGTPVKPMPGNPVKPDCPDSITDNSSDRGHGHAERHAIHKPILKPTGSLLK